MKYNGAKIDDRKKSEKDKDYSHKEVGKSSVINWTTRSNALKEAKKYEARNQFTTSACGAFSAEMVMKVLTGIDGEPAFVYRLRANYSGEGMFHSDVGNILVNKGIVANQNINKTEADYNAYTPTGDDASKIPSYITLNDDKYTIDDIADILNNKQLPLHIFVYWNGQEWSTDKPEPIVGTLSVINSDYKHYVCAIPQTAFIYKKKKYFIIKDSAHFGGYSQREISENWVNERFTSAIYPLGLSFKNTNKKPKWYEFTRDLTVGDQGEDVLALQKILQLLGFFPNIETTGYFGGITRQAVKDFQKKYEQSILWTVGLKLPTGYFGKSSMKKLKELCL